MTSSCPRIVVAGTNSGVGKTSVSLALVSALARRGLRVQAFKVGPDYLDPTYLSVASGRPCYNLDGWMTNRDYVRQLVARAAWDADIVVVEGVMGLFDGADFARNEGSTAEIAAWLDAPVLLVVNVHGVARSIAPLVKGFDEFEPDLKLAGVVANHCGSEKHGRWLAEALKVSSLPELVAAIPRGAFPQLPSRHLGLVTANDRLLDREILDRLAQAFEKHASVETIVETARTAGEIEVPESEQPPVSRDTGLKVGIAHDAAFHFYYADNLEALEAAGCDLIRFSPLDDKSIPHGVDALYFGGGYPEEFAQRLSENTSMMDSIRQFAQSGKPVYGECGGLMYLSLGIETRNDERYPLTGLLPVWTRMLDRLKSLGYAEVTLAGDSLFGRRGSVLRGHEFHYSELLGDPAEDGTWTPVYRVQYRRTDADTLEGFQMGNILLSYVHLHFASRSDAVGHFVAIARDSV